MCILGESCSSSRPPAGLYLPRSLHVDGDDVETVAAQLAGPAASLADPLQQAVLVGVTHRAVAPTRVQQVALETRGRAKVKRQEGLNVGQQGEKYYNEAVGKGYSHNTRQENPGRGRPGLEGLKTVQDTSLKAATGFHQHIAHLPS